MYDCFYGMESEQVSFYRIPKVLFTDERFKGISAEAKVLYGLLLDRMALSAKNGWMDKNGRVYIAYTIEDIMDAMGCADQKAGKLLYEREHDYDAYHFALDEIEHAPHVPLCDHCAARRRAED